MKKSFVIVVVICVLMVMALSSCRSSKPCPAYRSVSPVTASVEILSETDRLS